MRIGTMGTSQVWTQTAPGGGLKDSAHLLEDFRLPKRVPQGDVGLSIEVYK
jgi:hypothetical protein